MDIRDSVLQAPESNDPTETQYPGQCLQTLSIIDKISFGAKKVHIQEINMDYGACLR